MRDTTKGPRRIPKCSDAAARAVADRPAPSPLHEAMTEEEIDNWRWCDEQEKARIERGGTTGSDRPRLTEEEQET